MLRKKRIRIVLDMLLTVMLVFEMFIQFTGDFLHEVVGFAFFATLIVHLALSARWMRETTHAAKTGKLHGKRRALTVMGALLGIDTVMLGVSSIAISGLLSSAGFVWTLGSYALWAAVHSVSAYALCALVVVHLAMHWSFVASAFKVPYDPSRRRAINTSVHAVAAVGALALGTLAVREGIIGSMPATGSNVSAATGDNANALSGDGGASSASSGTASNSDSVKSRGNGRHAKGAPSSTESTQGLGSNSPSASSAASPESSQSSTSSSASGICNLCHKQCLLSNPRCDKPYRQGLL